MKAVSGRATVAGLVGLALLAAWTAPRGAVAEEGPVATPEPALRLAAKAGDTLRFRRTATRKALCEALDRNGDESVTQEYTVKVVSVEGSGGSATFAVEVAFGPARGHYTDDEGAKLSFDSERPLPEPDDVGDLVAVRHLVLFAGRTVKATLDARGKVRAVEGVREAVAATLAGTPFAAFLDEYTDEEAVAELQVYLPVVPPVTDNGGPGASWNDGAEVDFGAGTKISYERRWKVGEPAGGTVTCTVAMTHVPGDKVRAGQENSGAGTLTDTRATADGFVRKWALVAKFQGRGHFDLDASATQTIERLPAAE
jgi:hypothetical protein